MVVMSSSSALSLCQGLAVEECPRDTSIRKGLGSPLCPLFNSSLMLKVRCVFDGKLGLALADGSSQCLVGHTAVGHVASSCFRARVSVKAGSLFTATITMADPTDWVCRILLIITYHRLGLPHFIIILGSCLGSPSTGSHPSHLFTTFPGIPQNACPGGLSAAVNAIGTRLRDPINSGLTRWHMTV